jgi:LacI family transcriptional regulator
MPAPRVTIAQVAAEASVSAMTVSNVLNAKPGASEATRRRVLDAAARLGYTAPANRGGRRGRTGMIGVLTLDLISEYSHEIIDGIAGEIAADERELLINAAVDAIRERDRIAFFAKGMVDGLLLIAPVLEPETVDEIRSSDLPVVVIDPRRFDLPLPRVSVDNYDGVRTGTQHLIDLGHRRIAYIRGEEDHESTERRYRGFADAMLLAGLTPDPSLITAAGFNRLSGRRATEQLLAGRPTATEQLLAGGRPTATEQLLAGRRLAAWPTAIVAGCDPIALGAVDAIRALGMSVPGDMSVLGFDDLPQAAHHTPALTTVRQPLHEMGAAATRALLTLISGQQLATDDIRLPATFIPRESTASPGGVT